MRYYYMSFMGHDNSMYGNQAVSYPDEFDHASAHQMLLSFHKQTCIVMFYQEISKERYNAFLDYVEKVEKEKQPASPGRVLKLIKLEE